MTHRAICECENPDRGTFVWRDDPDWASCVQCDGRVRPLTEIEKSVSMPRPDSVEEGINQHFEAVAWPKPFQCLQCGSMVTDIELHERWHQQLAGRVDWPAFYGDSAR